jgi:hypothetical protein
MFEYAISCGEGTLLDYGVSEADSSFYGTESLYQYFTASYDLDVSFAIYNPATVIIGPASPDCVTGQ